MKVVWKISKYLLLAVLILLAFIVISFGHSDIPLEELKAKYAEGSSFIDVNGMEVHYRDEGLASDSLPLVLIHGTGSSLHTFDVWAQELSRQHRVIRLDMPAFGLTGPFPNRDYSIAHYVDFLHAFLSELNVDKCILGGNSLGGCIAWNYCIEHPQQVEKLILIDASGYPNKEASTPLAFTLARMPVVNKLICYVTPSFIARKSVENVYADKSKLTDDVAQRYFELTLRKGNRQAFVDRMNTEMDTSTIKSIKSIQQNTLILWGEEDRLIPLKSAYRFAKDLPKDTLVVLPGSGHVPMEENPLESLDAVFSFLNK